MYYHVYTGTKGEFYKHSIWLWAKSQSLLHVQNEKIKNTGLERAPNVPLRSMIFSTTSGDPQALGHKIK